MNWKSAAAVTMFVYVTLGAAPPLLAQAVQTSSLTGTIKDSTGAVLPGVTVNVSSPSMVGGVQTSVSDSQGIYRFPALRPGIYSMETTLSGFNTVKRSDITLPLGTTVTIDVSLAVASVSETVQVSGEAPVIDVKSSASNTQLSEAMLQNLPTGRFQPDIINLTPGVNSSVAYGGSQSSNALLMDGVDVSDPEAGTPWSFFNYNWVEQVQIVALGANAEYRRVHRRRRQQHHPVRQQQLAWARRVPDRAEKLGRRQHDLAVRGAAQNVHAPRDQDLLGRERPGRRTDRQGQAVLFLRLSVLRQGRPAGRLHRRLHDRKRSAVDEQGDMVGLAERPRRGLRRGGQVRRRRPRRQRPPADHRGHRAGTFAGSQLERPGRPGRSIPRRC